MNIVAIVCSVIVIAEFVLVSIGMLSHLPAQIRLIHAVTGYDLTRPVTLTLGVLSAAGVAGVVAGFWQARWAVIAGGYFSLYTGALLVLSLRHGNRGMLLVTGSLFFLASLGLFVSRLLGSR